MQLRLLVTLESVDRVGQGFDDRHRVTQEELCQEDTRDESRRISGSVERR
jgi:hypothetical protein